MNLIPDKSCIAPNYWYIWALQNYIYGQGQDSMILSGKIIEMYGLNVVSPGNVSDPGLLIYLEKT